jgi:hypothetical protein
VYRARATLAKNDWRHACAGRADPDERMVEVTGPGELLQLREANAGAEIQI